MKKTKKLWLGFSLTSALMAGTSLGGGFYAMESFEPELYQEKHIVIDGDTLSQDAFAENIEEIDGVWFYRDKSGKKLTNLNTLSDFRTKGDLRHRIYQNLQLQKQIDTIVVKKDIHSNKLYYFYSPKDSVLNIRPSLGIMGWNRLRIRHFVSDDPAIQAQLDVYNNALNCTERHERQHFLGAQNGLNLSGRSYETVFADNCMDEIAANIAQLKEQRNNYFNNGRNPKFITSRFAFYRDWVENNHPQADKITKEEAEFIANGVFDSWKKEKFPHYISQCADRAIHTLANADYNGCQDKPEEHTRLMHKILNIDDIDFYQYIEGREQEFIHDLPQENKDKFALLLKVKKNKMDYFAKVGQKTDNDPEKKHKHFENLKLKHEWNKFVSRLTGGGRN